MVGSAQAPSAPRTSGEHRGLNGGGREQLAGVQRGRLVAAMVDVTAERGLAAATVTRVVARSGVSRRTFYEHFEDREACFLAAFEDSVERLAAATLPAYAAPGPWAERVRAALAALLEALTRERAAARVAVVEALGAGPRALERRRRVLDAIAAAIDADGEEAAGKPPAPLMAEGALGGALALLHARLVDPGRPQLAELLSSLVATIVLPYLGAGAARRELERPVAAVEGTRPRASDPLRDLRMRLTYRTMRVLLAVGELSEASGTSTPISNRAVADAAGIRDQGQISKLLARLQQLGLLHNAARGRVKGEPNAWTLSERGKAVRAAVAPR